MVKRASCGRGWGALTPMAVALGLSLLASAASASDRSTCKYFSQLPDDCAAAEQRKYDNLRGYRFEQIDLYARDVIKKLLYVSIYNTTGQNDGDDTRELGCPVLRRTYGPEEDRQAVPGDGGADQSAALLGARLARRPRRRGSQLRRPGCGLDGQCPGRRGAVFAQTPSPAYRAAPFGRTAIEGFKKGSKVYLLDDPKGRTWVLAAYTTAAVPSGSIDDLDSLGDQLKLPEGWKFRTAKLPRELILEPKGGFSAVSTEDDKGDVYHLAGPGQSNFTP